MDELEGLHLKVADLERLVDELFTREHRYRANVRTYTNADSPVTLTAEMCLWGLHILLDCSSGVVIVNLPSATCAGWVHVKKSDGSANKGTVQRTGSDTIEGATFVDLTAQYSDRFFYADGGSVWYMRCCKT